MRSGKQIARRTMSGALRTVTVGTRIPDARFIYLVSCEVATADDGGLLLPQYGACSAT